MLGGMGAPFSEDILRAPRRLALSGRGWFGSRNGVRGASLEGVCVGAMVLHNMERGKFDFKETQTPGTDSGSQVCICQH
jgi:hypothetical protein